MYKELNIRPRCTWCTNESDSLSKLGSSLLVYYQNTVNILHNELFECKSLQ